MPNLAVRQHVNGLYESNGTADMDTNRIVDILFELQKTAAVRDEKLDQALHHLDRIQSSQEALKAQNSLFERRIETLEKRGLGAWMEGGSAKTIAKFAALIIGLAAAIAVFAKLFTWISAHVQL